MRRCNVGKDNPMWGRVVSQSTRQKISQANLKYRHGWKASLPLCTDCKKAQVSGRAYKRCMACSRKQQFYNNPANNPNYKGGRYTSVCSECGKTKSVNAKFCQQCGKSGRRSNRFGIKPNAKSRYGKRCYFKGVCFRSTYEQLYAKYLTKQRTTWQYEPKAFDLGNATYRPDFYLPKTNTYIEVKGYWFPEALTKFKRFKKLYPKIKIKVIMRNYLISKGVL